MKAALIVLILLAVIFVVVVVLGAGTNKTQSAPSKPDPTFAENYSPPSWSQTLNGMLAPFGPKLKLQNNTFKVGPNLPPVKIAVPANNPSALSVALFGHSTRKATFSVKQPPSNPCAGIVYQAPSSAGGSSSTLDQNLSLQPSKSSDTTLECPPLCTALPAPPKANVKNHNEADFMILDQGGTITMKGIGTKPCTVQLE